MKYNDAIEYLDNFSNYEKKAHLLKPRFSLTAIRKLLKKSGNPEKAFPSIHVAGTVGKGSVCHVVESVLREAGYKTALYSSPHLIDIRERITIGGRVISKKSFLEAVARIRETVGDVFDELTYFEALTALAFDAFARAEIDVAIMETGLGGRLDATNVVPPFVGVITTLGWDHAGVLGPTLTDIAGEKAGIIKRGATIVSSRQHWRATRVIERTCRGKKAALLKADPADVIQFEGTRNGRDVYNVIEGQGAPYKVELPLTGDFQAYNLATALRTLEALGERGFRVATRDVQRGIRKVAFPGRMEYVQSAKMKGTLLLDGAHNEPAARALSDTLLSRNGNKETTTFIIGMLQDKDAEVVMKHLCRAGTRAVVCGLHFDRATPATQLAREARRWFSRVIVADDMADAIDKGTRLAAERHTTCVTGSLYAVAEAKIALES